MAKQTNELATQCYGARAGIPFFAVCILDSAAETVQQKNNCDCCDSTKQPSRRLVVTFVRHSAKMVLTRDRASVIKQPAPSSSVSRLPPSVFTPPPRTHISFPQPLLCATAFRQRVVGRRRCPALVPRRQPAGGPHVFCPPCLAPTWPRKSTLQVSCFRAKGAAARGPACRRNDPCRRTHSLGSPPLFCPPPQTCLSQC